MGHDPAIESSSWKIRIPEALLEELVLWAHEDQCPLSR